MDIKTVYPAQQPSEADFLWGQSFAEEGFGLLVRDMIGTGPLVAGLPCTPTSPASMTVNVGPGRIYSNQPLRPTGLGQIAGLGGLAPDTNTDHYIVKQGLLRDTTNVGGGGSPFTAPATPGQSINYLIQAAFLEQDSTAVQRTFYNSQNPNVAIPSNVSEFRQCVLQLSVKAGSPATTGSQVTPTADAGKTPVWVVTVAYGQTSITSGNIVQHPSAPYNSLVNSGAGLATVNSGVVTVQEALPADVLTGSATNKVMTPGDTYNAFAEVPLYINGSNQLVTGSASGSALDMSTFLKAGVTLNANVTLPNPANPKVGQQGRIRFAQDATGSRTLAYGTYWKRAGGPGILTTTPSATDILVYEVITPTFILYDLKDNPS